MKEPVFFELNKNKSSANLLVGVLSKEKYFELKNEKNYNLIVWKYVISDHSTMMEFFSLDNFTLKIGEKRKVKRTFDIFYRGKKRLIGNLGTKIGNFILKDGKIGELNNNLSKKEYKKTNFIKKYKIVNK